MDIITNSEFIIYALIAGNLLLFILFMVTYHNSQLSIRSYREMIAGKNAQIQYLESDIDCLERRIDIYQQDFSNNSKIVYSKNLITSNTVFADPKNFDENRLVGIAHHFKSLGREYAARIISVSPRKFTATIIKADIERWKSNKNGSTIVYFDKSEIIAAHVKRP